jgi:glycosyl transferase family 25
MAAALTLPDFFGVSYLINLPERNDRLRSIAKQMAAIGWRLDASGVMLFAGLRYREAQGFPSAPIRGCFQSHLQCLRQAKAAECQSVLIMEDDIALSSAIPRLTSKIVQELQSRPWDFVYFGHHATGPIPKARHDTTEAQLRFHEWTEDVVAAEFYAVSASILPRLIAHLENIARGPKGDRITGPMPVDGAYNIFRRSNADVRCLVSDPRLGWQISSRSDITPHPLDAVPLLRPVNALMRRIKRASSLWWT